MATKLTSLEELFVEHLRDLYSAENQLISALPRMAEAASSPDLAKSFQEHFEETKDQVRRIEAIFAKRQESPRGKKCVGMEGLILEGDELIRNRNIVPEVRDAGLIAAAQKVEHYEIASYGTVRTYAQSLGLGEVARILQETLDEEGHANERLTALAESHINMEAE